MEQMSKIIADKVEIEDGTIQGGAQRQGHPQPAWRSLGIGLLNRPGPSGCSQADHYGSKEHGGGGLQHIQAGARGGGNGGQQQAQQ